MVSRFFVTIISTICCLSITIRVFASAGVFPQKEWIQRSPSDLHIDESRLEKLSKLIGGNGCVVKDGYLVYKWGDERKSEDVASAFKPVLTTLLFIALQHGLIETIHEPLSKYQPDLLNINGGKDAKITWFHLANQISGYGLKEPPGKAYSYNDNALALYYDTLMEKVFKNDGTEVLKKYIADPLGFEDSYTFNAFGKDDRPGRLAVSVRDFARFGLMILNEGKWCDKEIIKKDYVREMLNNPLPPDFPLTSGEFADMLPNQRSIGGTRNITQVGPGYYSFNWWLNGTNKHGKRLLAKAPTDTILASGHGGKRVLMIIPSMNLIVCWNDTKIDDQDDSFDRPDTLMNQATELVVSSVLTSSETSSSVTIPKTLLGINKTMFTLNGKPEFLLGISYYGALGADEKTIYTDLDLFQKYGFNWIRVWATWAAFNNEVSAVDPYTGKPREPFMSKLKWLVSECDRRGVVVDITLSRGNDVTGKPRLENLESHKEAVKSLILALKEYRNWYLDLSNERNIRDKRYTSSSDLKELIKFARSLLPELLVTASHAGDLSKDELRNYLADIGVDFISPHRPRDKDSPTQTENQTSQYLQWMKEIGSEKPVHYQEPFRRNFGNWEPQVNDFITDLLGAKKNGAAGWCFHNGDNRTSTDGTPRRSFDLRYGSLFSQLDEIEKEFIEWLGTRYKHQ
jgi:hypothetical protein